MQDKIKFIREKFEVLDVSIQDDTLEKYIKYYEMLIEKNKVMNLTSITEFEDVVVKHFLDSLLIIKNIDLKNINNVIDIGTGAGFPGLPLKILFPDLNVVLMDSLKKRIKFLQEVIDELQLENINVLHSRAEDLARKEEHREKYDLVVSRAVANLSTLSEYCLPFTKVGGAFISYKSNNIDDEVDKSKKAVKILGGNIKEIKYTKLDDETERAFVIIDKIKNTPKKYPRKAGTPTSEPL